MVIVNGASFVNLYLGTVDVSTALITEPTASKKFFLV